MSLSLNQVVKTLNNIADSHQQIGHFFFGEVPNFDSSGTTNGVSMIVELEPAELKASTLTHSFRIYFGDIVHKDLTNRSEVLSDCMRVALDVIYQLQAPTNDWVLENKDSLVLTDFEDSFTCEMYGYYIPIRLKTSNPFDRCAIPQTSSETGSFACAPVTIRNSDGTVNTTVASGGTYTLAAAGSCADATVSNSDDSYSVTVASGGSLELADNTYKVYVDSVLESTATGPSIKAQTINIQ